MASQIAWDTNSKATITGTGGQDTSTPTTPANPTASVQYNSSGSFAGSANLTFSGTVLALTGSQTISSTLGITGLTTLGAVKFGGANSTGAGSALLGAANCPAVTATAVFTWITITTADGSTAYIPCWK